MKPRGRHPDKALSAVRVRAISEPGRYADGNGLYLVVDPSGAKRWVLRTVVRGKRRTSASAGCVWFRWPKPGIRHTPTGSWRGTVVTRWRSAGGASG